MANRRSLCPGAAGNAIASADCAFSRASAARPARNTGGEGGAGGARSRGGGGGAALTPPPRRGLAAGLRSLHPTRQGGQGGPQIREGPAAAGAGGQNVGGGGGMGGARLHASAGLPRLYVLRLP